MLSKTFLIIVAALIAATAWLVFSVSQPVFFSTPVPTKSALIATDLPTKLRTHVETLVRDFHPRDHTNLTRLDQTSEYIQKQLISATPNRGGSCRHVEQNDTSDGTLGTAKTPATCLCRPTDALRYFG
jgi:hypothetical protein